MENLGTIIISAAMIFLTLTFILLVIELYNYFFDKAGGVCLKKFSLEMAGWFVYHLYYTHNNRDNNH